MRTGSETTAEATRPALLDLPPSDTVARFAAVNAAPYRRHYEQSLHRRRALISSSAPLHLPLIPSWHWAAFLMTVPWMMYRKMYSGGLILVALPVFLNHILPGSLFLGSGLLIALTAGVCGKSWYVEHIVRRFAKARHTYPKGPNGDAYLARARGVSLSAGIFGALIQFVAVTVIVLDLTPLSRF